MEPSTHSTMTDTGDSASFIAKFNEMCVGLFNSSSSYSKIVQYQKDLQLLSSNPQYFAMIAQVLLSASTGSTTFFAAAIATSHIKRFGNFFSPRTLMDLGENLLKAPFFASPYPDDKTQSTVYQLLATILKYTWFEQSNPLKQFLSMLLTQPLNKTYCDFLQTIVDEMQSADTKISATYRRVYYSFECKYLGRIAKSCILFLLALSGREEELPLLKAGIKALHSCLKYSFQTGKEDDTCDFYRPVLIPTMKPGCDGWEILQNLEVSRALILFLFNMVEKAFHYYPDISAMCLSILALIGSLKKSFFLEAEAMVHRILMDHIINLCKVGHDLIDKAPKLFRELCVLISRINRNLSYLAHDQPSLSIWLDSVFSLTITLLSSSATSNEMISTASYLMDFWSKISYSFSYSPGLAKAKAYIVEIYKNYVQFYARAIHSNEDVSSAHEMAVLYKEPLASLSRVSLEECGQWVCKLLVEVAEAPSESSGKISDALGLLVYAGEELLKCNPKSGVVNYQEPDNMEGLSNTEEERYYSTCGETAATIIYVMENWKQKGNSVFLLLAYTSYIGRIVKVFCRNVKTGNSLAVFAKIVIRLGWEDENKVLEYIINWLLENMVIYHSIPHLFQKLTKVVKGIVEHTVAQGEEKALVCGNLLLKDTTLNSLFGLHFNRAGCFLGNSHVAVLCKNLYYSFAKLLFLKTKAADRETICIFCNVLMNELTALVQSSEFQSGNLSKSLIESFEGLFMNLIGILQATDLNRIYETLFNAIIKDWLPLLVPIAQKTLNYPSLTKTLLKLLEEITSNRLNRVKYYYTSNQATLLYETSSTVIEGYIHAISSMGPVLDSEGYERKYAPLSYIYKIFNNLVLVKIISEKSADYFGKHLENLLITLLKGFIQIPEDEVFSYSKKLKVGFEFILIFLKNFPKSFARNILAEDFGKLLQLLKEGYLSIHQYICIACYESVDALLNMFASQMLPSEFVPPAQKMAEDIMRRALGSMLRGEISNLESISSSLFSIFVFLKDRANEILTEILTYYGGEMRKNVKECIEGLAKFVKNEIGDKAGRKEFQEALKKMIELMKLTEEMIIS